MKNRPLFAASSTSSGRVRIGGSSTSTSNYTVDLAADICYETDGFNRVTQLHSESLLFAWTPSTAGDGQLLPVPFRLVRESCRRFVPGLGSTLLVVRYFSTAFTPYLDQVLNLLL
jgi:hypothetical protein